MYSPEIIADLKLLVKDCGTWEEAKDLLVNEIGSHPDNVRRLQNKYLIWQPQVGKPSPGQKHTGDFDVNIETSKATTLGEVMEMCKIDSEQWESRGFSVRRGTNGYTWNARFSKKKEPIDINAITQLFLDRVSRHSPAKWSTNNSIHKKDKKDCLYVMNIQDLHLAKLAWSPETGGADWDIRIAEQAYKNAVEDLIAKAPVDRIEEVLLILGSDLLQVDNDKSTTTSGTYVDSDSRLAKAFDVATKMVVDEVEKLAIRFKVRLIVIPGNHDSTVSLFVGKYVEAFFRNHPNVVVDSAPKSRKYYGYGKTLIGFDHGEETKLKALPLLIMRENQATISNYKFQEVLTGHLHGEQVKEEAGVKVRVAPALCASDRWHARKGLVGNLRQSQGLLYQRDNGLEAIFYSSPLD